MEPVTYFHSHVQIITRGKGKSAVASAAYQASENIKNEYDGIVHDYTRKGGVVHTEILLPDHAPRDYYNRAILWNAVEKIEKVSNAQLARGFDIALPVALTMEQNISLARRYVQESFVNAGMCADLCVHDKNDGNPHMHIMLTMRPINDDGTWGCKQKKEYILDSDGNKIYDPLKRQYKCRSIPSTDWNNREKADEWRKAWEDMANAELERFGFEGRLDRRSYEEQGIEKIPTVHLGPAAHQMEKRGINTERGNINREIEVTNKQIQQLRARINKLDKWIADETANTTSPTLVEIITNILGRCGKYSGGGLLAASQMLIFLTNNDFQNLADLEKKVDSMNSKVRVMGRSLRDVERRIATLDEHLMHSGNFKKYRKTKKRYEELYSEYRAAKKETGFFAERRAQKALDAVNEYHEAHRSELFQFDKAEEYLRSVLQERFDPKKLPPIAMWQNDRAAKIAEKDALYRDYAALKEDTQKVEQIRRSVTEIMRTESRDQTQRKLPGMEL